MNYPTELQIAAWIEEYFNSREHRGMRYEAFLMLKSCDWTRDQLSDAWADAIQSDLEHGVKWLSENASREFNQKYPEISRFGLLLHNEGESK